MTMFGSRHTIHCYWDLEVEKEITWLKLLIFLLRLFALPNVKSLTIAMLGMGV